MILNKITEDLIIKMNKNQIFTKIYYARIVKLELL